MASKSEIIVYEFHPSYYSQMARLSLVENGIPFTRKHIDILKGANYEPEYLKINPACEVPAMTVNGEVINGSQAILDYAAKTSGATLNPKAEKLRKRCYELPIPQLSAALVAHPEIVPGLGQLPVKVKGAFQAILSRPILIKEMVQRHPELKAEYEKNLAKFQAVGQVANDADAGKQLLGTVGSFLDDVENQLTGQKEWLFGTDFTSADVAVAVLLGRLELLGISDNFFGDSHRGNVAEYYRRLKERPSFKQECVTSLG